jgi:hypothetical protein
MDPFDRLFRAPGAGPGLSTPAAPRLLSAAVAGSRLLSAAEVSPGG